MADDLSWPARHTTFSAASVSLPRQRLQCKAVQENTLLAHPELQEHQEKALPFRAAQMAILEDPDAPQAQDALMDAKLAVMNQKVPGPNS